MPIYEYQCPACHRQFEEMQKISEPPLTQCPHCHSHGVKKLMSACGFELKGSGWYVTDFKNKSDSATASASTADTQKEAKDSATTTTTTTTDTKKTNSQAPTTDNAS